MATTTDITVSKTINGLCEIFSRFGFPAVIVTDNRPQFTSSEFNFFLNINRKQYKTSTIYHPATNGQIERYVQVKRKPKLMIQEPGSVNDKLVKLLM